jgi:hypothetical protein
MANILFPTSTAPGQRPGEGSGRLINCYAEALDAGARAQYARRRAPGLLHIATPAHIGCRGLHYFNGDLYVAQAERLSRVNLVGGFFIVTDLGELPGEGRVTFARNNKAPVPDILCVTEDDVFVVHQAAPPASLGAGDLPQPLTVAFLDGYFIFAIRDGRFFFSALNDTTVNALDFATAQSRPGGIYNAVPFGQQLFVMGPSSIEVWQNAGNATGSPFSRAAVIPKGLASTFAVAGFEEGFSTLVFVGDDNGVYRLDGGYAPAKISTPDLDRLIEKTADKTLIDVTVSVTSGHNWATVTGPDFSWTYELGTGFWHERASYLQDYWRAVCSVKAFDGWVMGDRETGDVWQLDPDEMTEGGHPLVMSVISLPLTGFPNRMVVPRADFDIIIGQGKVTGQEPIETDPVVLISWSDDGGATFGNPLKRSLGRLAKHTTPVSVNRTGMASRYGRVWRLDISDPVFASILSGTMDTDPRSR